ncbi:MAG: hypothetical protein AAGI52_09570 [Bacteroidota bacterium]
MRSLLTALLTLVPVLVCAQNATQVENFEIQDLTFEIQYEAEEPEGTSAATVTVRARGDRPLSLESLRIHSEKGESRSRAISLARNEDGSYSGSGRIPEPAMIDALMLRTPEDEITVELGREFTREGDAQWEDMSPILSAGGESVEVKDIGVELRCCPAKIVITIYV